MSDTMYWANRAEEAEAKLARVQEILDVDGQWYSGPLLARTIQAALDGD